MLLYHCIYNYLMIVTKGAKKIERPTYIYRLYLLVIKQLAIIEKATKGRNIGNNVHMPRNNENPVSHKSGVLCF